MEDMGFIRQDFYIEPPKAGASTQEWNEWIKRDNRKAAAAKAQHTKSLDFHDRPEEFAESTTRKVNGRWVQTTAIGFVGDAEEGTCEAEAIVDAKQEHHLSLVRMEATRHTRGNKSKGKSARRRKNKKRRK